MTLGTGKWLREHTANHLWCHAIDGRIHSISEENGMLVFSSTPPHKLTPSTLHAVVTDPHVIMIIKELVKDRNKEWQSAYDSAIPG
jgi:hypothetical protein